MSRTVPFKIELKGGKELVERLKGAEKGHGAYAVTTQVAEELLYELQLGGGRGVHYDDGPSGRTPESDWASDWAHKQPGAQYPTGYLQEHHHIGGRKGNTVTIASDAPYTSVIISGGTVGPNDGVVAPNNYPERTLRGFVFKEHTDLFSTALMRYYNLRDYL